MDNSRAFRSDKYFSLKSPFVGYLLKWVTVLVAFAFLFYKLLTFDQYPELISHWKQLPVSHFWWLAGVILLLPFNWVLESLKWKCLVSHVQKINTKEAVKSVLAGISTGFFTPNRVGELVGRVTFLHAENRKAGVTLGVVNSLTQNLIMALCGVPACICFFRMNLAGIQFDKTLYLAGLTLGLLIVGLFYIYLPELSKRLQRSRYAEKVRAFTTCLAGYSGLDLTLVMLLSLGRYLIFSAQFFLMLRFFNVELTVLQALISIPTSYLFVTFTPSWAFSEAAVRSSCAVLVIGAFSGPVVDIALASVLIWAVNFIIPMFFGSLVLVKQKA